MGIHADLLKNVYNSESVKRAPLSRDERFIPESKLKSLKVQRSTH